MRTGRYALSLSSRLWETYITYTAENSWKMGTRMYGGRANDTSCCALIESNNGERNGMWNVETREFLLIVQEFHV